MDHHCKDDAVEGLHKNHRRNGRREVAQHSRRQAEVALGPGAVTLEDMGLGHDDHNSREVAGFGDGSHPGEDYSPEEDHGGRSSNRPEDHRSRGEAEVIVIGIGLAMEVEWTREPRTGCRKCK